MNISRIPEFYDKSFDGMLVWFAEMSVRNLLFHPDDPPESIVSIKTDEKFFNNLEVEQLNHILTEMFSIFGDQVYEAAYPIFMKCCGIQLDA